jgi:hypothetical protein
VNKERALEKELLMAAAGKEVGKRDTALVQHEGKKCLILGDSIVRTLRAEHSNMKVEGFPRIRTEQLHRVMENRDLGSPDIVLICVGTNDLRRTRNLDYVMGEVYAVAAKEESKSPHSSLVLSGVLRRRDVPWRRVGTVNDRYGWVAKTLGVYFVDPSSWIEEGDFDGDGLHRNRRGARRLGHLYPRVCGFGGEGPTGRNK